MDDVVEEGKEISSVQNGFLCFSTEHRYFNNYETGINPDVIFRFIVQRNVVLKLYRKITESMTMSGTIHAPALMGVHSTVTPTSTAAIYLPMNSYETIFDNVCLNM